jgi:hypothetical protein
VTRHLPIEAALRDRNLLGAALGDAVPWQTWFANTLAAMEVPSPALASYSPNLLA